MTKNITKKIKTQSKFFWLTKHSTKDSQVQNSKPSKDFLAIESPLKILISEIGSIQKSTPITTLLRTTNNNKALVAGFLFAEGYFRQADEIYDLDYDKEKGVMKVISQQKIKVKNRLFLTHGGCGSCSIDDLREIYSHIKPVNVTNIPYQIESFIEKVESEIASVQKLFNTTGGVHASGLFDKNANLLSFAEDVGRHNALDKAIGKLWLKNQLHRAKVAWVSGRMGFELVQKAINADLTILISVGAPTTLAIEFATNYGLFPIGFCKNAKFNCYGKNSSLLRNKIFKTQKISNT